MVCSLTPSPCQAENYLALTHSLQYQTQVLVQTDTVRQDTLIDASPLFDAIKALLMHAASVRDQMISDLNHLSSQFSHAFVHNDRHYAFTPNKVSKLTNKDGLDIFSPCRIVATQQAEFNSTAELEAFADAVMSYNDNNKGTNLPLVTKIVLPLETDERSKTYYVLTKHQFSPASTWDTSDLLRTSMRFPVYDLTTKAFIFPEDDDPQHMACDLTSSPDKIQNRAEWRTFVERRRVHAAQLHTQILAMKQTLLTHLNSFDSFTYSNGASSPLPLPHELSDLAHLGTQLSGHSASNIQTKAALLFPHCLWTTTSMPFPFTCVKLASHMNTRVILRRKWPR